MPDIHELNSMGGGSLGVGNLGSFTGSETPDYSAMFNSLPSSAPDAPGDKQAGMGIGAGLLQLFQSNQKKNEANAAFPQWYDPQQMSFLSEINQKRKAMETGAEFASGINAVNSSMGGTNAGILQAGAGNVSGTIQGLLQSQRIGQDQINQVLANGQAQGLQYNNMYREMLDKISARKMQLQLAKSQQARAEWAQKAKDSTANLMAGSSYLGGGGGGSKGGGMGFNPMDLLSKIGGGAGAAGGASSVIGAAGLPTEISSVLSAAPEIAAVAL